MLFSLDYSKGFGGKFGVQSDRVDKSAVGWDHQEKLAQHDSQKGLNAAQISEINHDYLCKIVYFRSQPRFWREVWCSERSC